MSSYLALNSPVADRVGLELVFLACFVLTLYDVRAAWRAGDRKVAWQWLVALSYGVSMELIAYNFLDNFWHARFTVQLYHQKLPLYVVFVYPVFLFTGLRLVQRWRLPALPEALLAGLAMCFLDVPFDTAGIAVGWWTWSPKDPNLAVRWLGVPVTSYYWYLIFGAVYSLLCRYLAPRVTRRRFAAAAAWAPLAGLGVIVFGVIGFLPFHGLKALGVPDGVVVGVHLCACALLAVLVRPRAPIAPLGALLMVPLLLGAWHLFILCTLPQHSLAVAVALAAVAGLVRLSFPLAPLSTPALEEVP
jgi:hypothetical protein